MGLSVIVKFIVTAKVFIIIELFTFHLLFIWRTIFPSLYKVLKVEFKSFIRRGFIWFTVTLARKNNNASSVHVYNYKQQQALLVQTLKKAEFSLTQITWQSEFLVCCDKTLPARMPLVVTCHVLEFHWLSFVTWYVLWPLIGWSFRILTCIVHLIMMNRGLC